jgi:hypothetical protein
VPGIDPLIARDCMADPVPWPERLIRQIVPRTRIRDCCWHHSIDWRHAAPVAVRLARHVRREHITDEDELAWRAFTLVHELGLPERQEEAVETLLNPHDGITLDHIGYDRWRLSYMNGRKRTHAMLEAGVHRTVVIRWRAPRRPWPQVIRAALRGVIHPEDEDP